MKNFLTKKNLTITSTTLLLGTMSFVIIQTQTKTQESVASPQIKTTPISQGTLTGKTVRPATLGFSTTRTITATLNGTITAIPEAGTQIGIGGELYYLNNQAVYLFRGQIPTWRTFEPGMSAGPDIKQLEQTLQELGYLKQNPNDKFTTATQNAIRSWQKATGQPQTGTIELGRIVFNPTELRIGEIKTKLAETVGSGSPIMETSNLEKIVNMELKLADQKLAILDSPVTIELPDGTTGGGRIVAIGAARENEADSKTGPIIPVKIALDDQNFPGNLQRSNVSIILPNENRENVLHVPIEALLATGEGNFVVEVKQENGTVKQVPVTLGLFSAGRVEISGENLSAEQEVVVPQI